MTPAKVLLASVLVSLSLVGSALAATSGQRSGTERRSATLGEPEGPDASPSRQDAPSRVSGSTTSYARIGYAEAATKAPSAKAPAFVVRSSARVWTCGRWEDSAVGGSFKRCEWK